MCSLTAWPAFLMNANLQITQLGFDCSSSWCVLFMRNDMFNAGRLPTAVAAHLTPQGGWVEFHPSSYPHSGFRDPSDPITGAAIPMLRPLAWFRLTTAAETELLRQREPNSEQSDDAPWWQDLAEPGMAEHWRGQQSMPQRSCVMTACKVISHHTLQGVRDMLTDTSLPAPSAPRPCCRPTNYMGLLSCCDGCKSCFVVPVQLRSCLFKSLSVLSCPLGSSVF